MIWKNQESCEFLLVGSGLVDTQKSQKFQLTFFFFFAFLSYRHGITNYFEILNFVFSNIIKGRVLTH